MSNKKGIHSNRCWLEGKLQEATIFFEEGVITEISKGPISTGSGIDDVGDKVLIPGVIDAHVHINEPGRTEWEGFDSGTMAAAAGGITTIVDMPLNASPVTITKEAFNQKLESTNGKLHVNVGFYAGLIPGSVHQLEELMNAGVLGVKVFLTHSGINEFPNVEEKDLDEAMPLVAKYNLPLLAHCEIVNNGETGALASSPPRYKKYVESRPKSWENEAVKLMIHLCRKHHCRTHIVHVSSAEALLSIKEAKREGLPVTAETCPHYLYFNEEEIPDGNTLYKCAPPIRDKANNHLLKQAFLEETLDFIASDHSPAPPSVKEIESGNLLKAWGGIAGIQFLLPAGWTSLKDVLSLEEFIPLATENPAKFLKVDDRKGKLQVGHDADFTIWSPEEEFEVKEEEILHKHKLSPYTGKQLYGVTYQTYVNGELVFNDKKITTKNAGRWLLRK
jgi:allantoinase